MFAITDKDILAVYEQLKDKYPLLMTTAFALDEGFTVDCPVLVEKATGRLWNCTKMATCSFWI